MAQTRKGSFAEAWANIAIGGSVNWLATLAIVPVLWDPASPKLSALYMTIFYTGVSLVRSYFLRRVFDGLRFGNAEAGK